jgi:hypothetical protein
MGWWKSTGLPWDEDSKDGGCQICVGGWRRQSLRVEVVVDDIWGCHPDVCFGRCWWIRRLRAVRHGCLAPCRCRT